MQSLRKAYAYPAESLVFVGVAFDGVLEGCEHYSSWFGVGRLTAIGFANVLTKSEVTLSVRDMVGFGREGSGRLNCDLLGIAWRQDAHDSFQAITRVEV